MTVFDSKYALAFVTVSEMASDSQSVTVFVK